MRLASMDIGTNSCRLLIVDKIDGQEPVLVYQTLRTTRIGEGIGDNGRVLKQEAIARTVEALGEFVALMKQYQVESCSVVATAAVREAKNSEEFLDLAKAKTGLCIRIISGEEEAWLSYLGVSRGLAQVPPGAVVIDVGGGSTEFIWSAAVETGVEVASVPLGAVRATEAAFDAPQIAQRLEPVITRVTEVRRNCLIGTGGTATTLAAMNLGLASYNRDLVHGSKVTKQAVDNWYERLAFATPEERLTIPGLQPQRADIIVAGIAIVKTALEQLGIEEIIISETDLLWGLCYS